MPRMSRPLPLLTSLRLPMLLFSLPYAIMWHETTDAGGWVMVVAHAALLLFYCTHFDALVLARGDEPRLSLIRDRDLHRVELIRAMRLLSGVVALVAAIALLALNWRLGALALIALGLILALTRSLRSPGARRKFVFAEVLWPLVVLVGPMWFVGAQAHEHVDHAPAAVVPMEETRLFTVATSPAPVVIPEAPDQADIDKADDIVVVVRHLSRGDIHGTILGALLLGAWVVLCLLRDEVPDRALGLRTIATRHGRGGAIALAVVFLAGAVALSSWGVGAGLWTWLTPPLVALTAMGVLLLLAQRMDDHAVAALWLGHATVAIALLATTA